ncbi:MAG TPA: thiol reductant ABC exporter subunit CydD [Solirubrobacteraceae bacterium]|nr:thiol reductant ABC exporter subunit CydD [Solirubrobacteraceae bacterium]
MPAPVDRRLLRESRAARTHLTLVGALALASAALIVAQAVLLACIIDRAALRHASAAALEGKLLALGAVLLARAAVGGGFELSAQLGASRAMSELRGRLARRLLGADGAAPAGGPAIAGAATGGPATGGPGSAGPAAIRTGELAAAAVQGVDGLRAYFAGYLPQLVLAAVVPAAVLAWAAAADPIAAGLLALTVPILIVFMVLIGKGARAQTQRRWQALSLLSSHFLDVVRGLPTLRAHRRERAQAGMLAEVGERYRSETMATLRVAFLSALVLELCAMVGTALAAATIGVQLVDGALSLTAGLTVLLLAPELYGPLRQIGQQFHAAADGTAAAARIYAVLDQPPALQAPASVAAPRLATSRVAAPPRAAPPRAAPRVASPRRAAPGLGTPRVPDPAREPVRLRAVDYEYPLRPGRVLERIDLELAAGEITALVGRSGAGKSTIARLIMRLADPSAGEVSCGGADLRAIDVERWRAQIAWVPQRPQLFAGTVAENIRLGAGDADAERVREAARAAGALAFIEGLAQGFDTPVGEDGVRLSAGQRQRIALARAILRDARLLVFDEPTAHLDETGAARIAELLPALAAGRTVLLIVHHPQLAEHAHRLVRIEHGRALETPTPAPATRAMAVLA